VLDRNITVPGKQTPGYLVEWFAKDPLLNKDLGPLSSTITVQGQMFFADNLPKEVPSSYFLKAQTTYTAQANTVMQIGLCVIGRARLYVDGKEVIDLYTSHPEKTHATPMFNAASMEKVGEISMEAGRQYAITVILANDSVIPGMGALNAGGLRIGLCPKFSAETALSSAIALAKEVDIPIVIAGLNADYETEAADRENLDLPPGIDNLITSILSANPNTVIITQSGTPILMPWVSHAPTVLHAWFGGQETGHAIADVLFGMTNPSGRLSLTFPARLEETPSFLTFGKADRELYYGEGVFLGYRYAEKLKFRPMFWLGYGLSYTSFSYSNLQMPAEVMLDEQSNKTFRVSVDVRNDGELNGAEVVQFYVRDHKSAVQRPEKELKGFTKVFVPAGKTVRAEVELDKYALSFWSEEDKAWVAEQGTFSISIGRSADPDDEVLSQDFELQARFVWNGI
jgi:beta-glucosidase